MGLSLEKKQELVGLRLEKLDLPTNICLAVKCAMDVSGSMHGLFKNGTVQETFDRLIPIGMRFDDNGSLESYGFASGAFRAPDITEAEFGLYVSPMFLPAAEKSGNLWGGTRIAEVLKLVREEAAPSGKTVTEKKTGGFLGLFKKTERTEIIHHGRSVPPAYLMLGTDGDTGDEGEVDRQLAAMEQESIYVQFFGIGTDTKFAFLKRMADKYDHVGFEHFPDLTNTSDQAMYDRLLTPELVAWIKKNCGQ